MKKLTLVALLLVVVISACKKDEEQIIPTENPTKSYEYLKVGNKWVYDVILNGNPFDSLVTEIIDENNGTFELLTKDNTYKQHTFLYVEDNKLKQYIKGQDRNAAVMLSKANATVGETWTIKDRAGQDSIVYTIKADNEKVTVPAGTYTCTKIEANYVSGWSIVSYRDKNYGIIKMETRANNSSITNDYNLRSVNF